MVKEKKGSEVKGNQFWYTITGAHTDFEKFPACIKLHRNKSGQRKIIRCNVETCGCKTSCGFYDEDYECLDDKNNNKPHSF